MRIVRIALENLNSLYGRHSVDFEQDLGDPPLFLIRGVTGAGKSTLMDAVSLALFGATPRLGRNSSEGEEDTRHVMSRGTSSASAQVVFSKAEAGGLQRYRATWQCWRAHRNPTGQFQAPRRVLERWEATGGAWEELVSDHRQKHFQPVFERVLEGLTVEDFQRMMLLAQGEFAAFLNASEEERAAILERLTSTQRFKELGRQAHLQRQDAERKLAQAGANRDAVQLLPLEEEQRLRGELEQLEQELEGGRERLRQVQAWQQWRRRQVELQRELEEARSDEQRARETSSSRQAELSRLAEHERCVGAAAALRERDGLAREAEAARAVLPGLQQEVERLRGELDLAQQALHEREEVSEHVQAELARLEPEMRRAREIRTRWAAARDELEQVERQLSNARDRLAAAVREREKGERELASGREQMRGAEGELEALSWARPFVESLAGLEQQVARLGAVGQELAESQRRACTARAELEAVAARTVACSARLAGAELSLEGAAAQERRASEALEVMLDGAPDVQARRRVLAARHAAWREVRRLAAELATRERASREREERMALLEAALRGCDSEISAFEQRIETGTGAAEALGQRIDELRWALSLAAARGRLQHGEPCPLCGSPDHPYLSASGSRELDREIATRCTALAQERNQAAEQVQHAQQRLAELKERRGQLRQELEQGREEGEASDGERARLLGETRSSLQVVACEERPCADELDARVAAAQAALDSLDRAEQARDAARERAATARRALADLRHELGQQQLAATLRRDNLEQQEQQLAAKAGELTEAEARLVEVLAQQGLEAGVGRPDFAAVLQRARSAVQALKLAEERALVTQRTLQVLTERQTGIAQLVTREESLLQETERAAAQRAADCHTVAAEAAGTLGGADPDALEAEWKARRDAALTRLQEQQGLVRERDEHLRKAQATLEHKKSNLQEVRVRLEQSQTALDARLLTLGLASVDELRVRLLADEEQAALAGLREGLHQAITTALVLVRRGEEALALHQGSRPAASELAELSAEALAQHAGTLEGEVELLTIKAAEGRTRLNQQARSRALHEEHERVYQERHQEWQLWQRLHRLIGINEGDVFKKFAQTLNLAELVARANVHLVRLAPRYALVPASAPDGQPRLSFSIEDAFQAGATRAVKTLSGGETFLVSLALALALADTRSTRMPVETLLLDEGFGTLDGDTLQVAMSALSALNARGTQVGIISHVEALKETIPACVVVEKLGNGRSRVRVETGRRTPQLGPELGER